MNRLAEFDGKQYKIISEKDRVFPIVTRLEPSRASGVIANTLRAMGKDPVMLVEYVVERGEEEKVVLGLGWKFSRAKVWKNIFEYYYRKR